MGFWLRNPFKKRPLIDREREALADKTIRQQTITVPVKNPLYHEIVGSKVRIYSRTDGLIEEVDAGGIPYTVALQLLKKHGGV